MHPNRGIRNRPRSGGAFWERVSEDATSPAERAELSRDQPQSVPTAQSPLRQPKPVQHPVFTLAPDRHVPYLASPYRPLRRVVRSRNVPPPAMANSARHSSPSETRSKMTDRFWDDYSETRRAAAARLDSVFAFD